MIDARNGARRSERSSNLFEQHAHGGVAPNASRV